MKKLLITLTGFAVLCSVSAQDAGKKIEFQNTIAIEEGDGFERVLEKAAHVVPTQNQLRALENEFIAFIHFGPNSFTRLEWGNGMEDPEIFDLKDIDTDQWCEAMKSAGMKMVILTAKHHDGFVMWQSRYTGHGIMSSDFRDGKGDVLKDLSASCKKYGLKLGVYLSPADLYQIENPKGLYGNNSQYTKRTIPRPVEGRPFKNTTKFEFELDDYNEYFMNQLFEVLTEYGPIDEVWFDGAHPKTKGGQKYNYAAWKQLIQTVAPKAVIFGREDIRWCGNESGKTRDTEWNVIPYMENPHTASIFPDMMDEDLGSGEALAKGKFLHYQQAETNTSIREGWFYRDDTHQKVRSADDVFDIYERSVGGNSTFLLNIPPNREGKFSSADVESLRETGKRIRQTYDLNLLAKAKGPKAVLDANPNTYISITPTNQEIIITTPSPITFNRFVIQEAIAQHGERVEQHALDVWENGNWKEVAHATNIGYKRILRFPEVTTAKIRLRFPKSRLQPSISNLSAHYYEAHPPQLVAQQSVEGIVSITPVESSFNWNAHGENIAENLNAGFKIYYTTDGSEPTVNSTLYQSPFAMQQGIFKAISILGDKSGPIYQTQIGLPKQNWTVLSTDSEVDVHKSNSAFDANPSTYWMSQQGEKGHFIALDLGQNQALTGFAYTPQQDNTQGMMAKGNIQWSEDGQSWHTIESFEFGNLINDPVKRYHYFKQKINTRFVRIEATEIAANGSEVAIAEIDLF